MKRDCAAPAVERLGLEDVAEEEDVFGVPENSRGTAKVDSCQVCVRVCWCAHSASFYLWA